MILNPEIMVENAAVAAQNTSLIDDVVTREAIELNIIEPYETEIKRLKEAIKEASDLLAERIYGSPARSPGHNARVVMEYALAKG